MGIESVSLMCGSETLVADFALSRLYLRNFPVFSRLTGNFSSGDSFAVASQHSHPVLAFLRLNKTRRESSQANI
jgi:hypothetical protein